LFLSLSHYKFILADIAGMGLKNLCEYLSVDLKHVVAFGDGDNDVEMLSMVGFGIQNRKLFCFWRAIVRLKFLN
jgi:3-deoxy-D-manno-octulosonate 8-phosphate phosphatase KdsC-like HAD superfamily phosphatase